MNWFRKLFAPGSADPVLPPVPDRPDDTEVEQALDPMSPVLDSLQKVARLQARQSAQVQELEGKLEAGFSDLRGLLTKVVAQRQAAPARWNELLDAADALDEAVLHAERTGQGGLTEGLRGVAARIGQFLAQSEVRRLSPLGEPPDPACFRVVGTIEGNTALGAANAAHEDGCIAQVIRAAVLEGNRVLREGEVLIVRRQVATLNNGEQT